jgi:hypothetical protein
MILFVLRILDSLFYRPYVRRFQTSASSFPSFWRNEMAGFVSSILHPVHDLLIASSVTHLYRRRRHSSVSCFFAER